MELNLWQSPKRADLPCTLRGFLETLGGPTAIHIPGKERERSRVLVTLSHGNEPSGLQAVYEWLKEERVPRVDVAIILGAVKAAPHRTDVFLPPFARCTGSQPLLFPSLHRSSRESGPRHFGTYQVVKCGGRGRYAQHLGTKLSLCRLLSP